MSGPASANTLFGFVDVQIETGDTIGAKRTAALMQERFPNAAVTPILLFARFYDHNQVDSLAQILARTRTSPVSAQRAYAQNWLASLAVLRGQLAAWPGLEAAARLASGDQPDLESSLEDGLTAALYDIVVRKARARGVARLDATLTPDLLRRRPNPVYYLSAARMYGMAQRPDRARAALAWYQAQVTDSVEKRMWVELIHQAMGEIALAEHRPRDALREFALSDTSGDGQPTFFGFQYPLGAGRAYDEAGNADSAILMLTRYETMPRAIDFVNAWDVVYRALVYKRLGELYEGKRDNAQAIANYAQFIALWKDADPDLQPVVADARRRLARLGGAHGVRAHAL